MNIKTNGYLMSLDLTCPLYVFQSSPDTYGCQIHSSNDLLMITTYLNHLTNLSYDLSIHEMKQQIPQQFQELEERYPMLTILLYQLYSSRLLSLVSIQSISIFKRGICTFVDKAKVLVSSNKHFGLMINSENQLFDIPFGKEDISQCNIPISVAKESESNLVLLEAFTNEVIGMIQIASNRLSTTCLRIQTMIDDILDLWPHSRPFIPIPNILNMTPETLVTRSIADEGGRLALSGSNGWAYFDYHLAMFGPQDVPLGPHRLQMALPPDGCDVNQYTVRIKDTIVAILRGGGCSFGVKVLNAQKLGAKGVIIVNTDNKKTMRLMATHDEAPLIQIPCITVSRRIQFYLEEVLHRFYLIDQHIVSIQPMIHLSNYEQRNQLVLPERITQPVIEKMKKKES